MISTPTLQRTRAIAAGLVLAWTVAGCATNRMMPTPVTYTGPDAKPLAAGAAEERRPPDLDLLFLTDRARSDVPGDSPYTAARSRSIAFGSATIEFGEDRSLALGATTELGHFPPIPYPLTSAPDGMRRAPAVVEAHATAKRLLQDEIERRLAVAPRKEIVVFVHGYHESFETATLTMGELCHFLGREFVCAVFTWPAGATGGRLFGYDVDYESSAYAVQDLVKVIRTIAATPGLAKIHFIAHSRGTDTLASALSDLSVEAYVRRSSPACEFKIGNVVLVAPDLDGDVAVAKIFKVFSDPDLPFGGEPDPLTTIPPSPGLKLTLYVSRDDKALATSGWLFGSIARLGRIDASMFTPDQIEMIGNLDAVDIVEVRGATDFFGHSYFVSNPSVSGDIVAMLRYGLRPNEPGRPLEQIAGPFWRVASGQTGP
ncbi:MAG: alpha/beta hydrolase [Burkholderiales bacterium]